MDTYETEIEAWHHARVQRLMSPQGWLALVAKRFLDAGETLRIGSDEAMDVRLPRGPAYAATVTFDGKTVRLAAAADGIATLADAPLRAGEFRSLTTDALGSADRVRIDTMTIDVMQKAELFALRIRDPEAPQRIGPPRIDRFPLDAKWRIQARFVAVDPPRKQWVDFGSGIADEMESPGVLEFTLDGQALSLVALYEDAQKKRLYVLFRDATSGNDTYGLGRFLYTSLPQPVADGAADPTVEIDFNRGLLPGCAFNDLATCPIPARENRVPVRIEAGEKNYLR
jgi:uncharacterized protein (DUF1684 family)